MRIILTKFECIFAAILKFTGERDVDLYWNMECHIMHITQSIGKVIVMLEIY